jgi:hypothetical protein
MADKSPADSKQSVLLSLDVFTKADEYVLDLHAFADELRDFSCRKPESLTLHFKHNASYAQAVDAWSWVKGNNSRAFILVEDHPACKTSDDDRQRRPWLVTDMDTVGNMSVSLKASKKTWKEVLHTYDMNFGQSHPPNTTTDGNSSLLDARSWYNPSYDWTPSLSIPLTYTFPRAILSDTVEDVGIDLICESCGTTGTLEIAGSISASLFDGLTKMELTVTAKAVTANVALGVQVRASPTQEWLNPYTNQFLIAAIPIGDLGISIPGLLTVGPNLQINGGITADQIQGAALFKSGVKASIPDPSTVGIDLKGKKKLSATGWTPKLDWDPLSVSASVNLTTEIYTEIAAAISFLVLDDDGFNADVGLRIPDLTVNAATVYNSKGVCKGSKSPFGAQLDMSIGAKLVVEEYVEANGDEALSLNVPLYSVPKALVLPSECQELDLGGIVIDPPVSSTTMQKLPVPITTAKPLPAPITSHLSSSSASSAAKPSTSADAGDSCETWVYTPTPDEQEYLNDEIPSAANGVKVRRQQYQQNVPFYSRLEPRLSRDGAYYLTTCDTKKTEPFIQWSYPGPVDAIEGTDRSRAAFKQKLAKAINVPLVTFDVGCSPPYSPSKWTVSVDDKATVLPGDKARWTKDWATEHIYERNWIREFVETLFVADFKPHPVPSEKDQLCSGTFSPFKQGSGRVVTATTDKTKADNYLQGLMQSVGTDDNWWNLTVVFPQPQNIKKFSMFAGKDIDTDISKKTKMGFNESVGRIGQIVAICAYMNDKEVQNRLTKTVVGIQKVL